MADGSIYGAGIQYMKRLGNNVRSISRSAARNISNKVTFGQPQSKQMEKRSAQPVTQKFLVQRAWGSHNGADSQVPYDVPPKRAPSNGGPKLPWSRLLEAALIVDVAGLILSFSPAAASAPSSIRWEGAWRCFLFS
jgi:hypothetical protein